MATRRFHSAFVMAGALAANVGCSDSSRPSGSGSGSGGTVIVPPGGGNGGSGGQPAPTDDGAAGQSGSGGQVMISDAGDDTAGGPAPTPDGSRTDGGSGVTDPGTMGDGDFMIAAPFQRAPEYTVAAGIKRGQIVSFTMNGADSKVYPGAYMRKAAVYVPADYVSGTEIPFMVAQDGLQYGYLSDIVPILDNYIAAGTLPAMAVVAADPSNSRSVEYDTVSDTFTRFVETELLPEAKKQVMTQAQLDLNLTSDPEGRSSYGGSSGGSCAMVMGWFGNYHRILTISGSFRPLQTSVMYPMGAAEFQNRLIAGTPIKPLRVFLEAGSMDMPGWKVANDQVDAALAAKGYHRRYVFAQGAGHTDGGAIHQFMPETLLWLWRGYPINK